MTVRELLESASEAERQRRSVVERMERRRALLGLHGGGGQPIAQGTVLDPMRQVDECLDGEADDRMVLCQLESELDDAWCIIGGISEMGSDDGANVLCRHYLWLEEWGEVAKSVGHTSEECSALAEMTLRWAGEIGIPRLREAGRWKSRPDR